MITKFLFRTALFFTAVSMVSCDKDFNEVGTDIIGEDHYGFDKDESFNVAAVPVSLLAGSNAVQTDGLTVNPLGVYDNPAFGRTTANFVTQVALSSSSLRPTIEGDVTIQEVKLYIPYFAKLQETDSEGDSTYKLDSIYGAINTTFNLKVFENNYFLRAQTQSGSGLEAQPYYNNMNGEIDAVKGPQLNNSTAPAQNTSFTFSAEEYDVNDVNDPDAEDTKLAPGLRMDIDSLYIREKIFNTSEANLSSQNLFQNHFRGLYFQIAQTNSGRGALNMMNFAGGTITVKYRTSVIKDHDNNAATPDQAVKTNRSIVMTLTGTTVSLVTHDNVPAVPADRLAVKGGQGYVSTIDLFNPEQIAMMKAEKWMINEANLTFFIDREKMSPAGQPADWAPEPRRLYLFDITNNANIADYTFDNTTSSNTKN
ncbi:MAG: DUF4270 domain-containing protein, partial [Proteobacteria bacterium]